MEGTSCSWYDSPQFHSLAVKNCNNWVYGAFRRQRTSSRRLISVNHLSWPRCYRWWRQSHVECLQKSPQFNSLTIENYNIWVYGPFRRQGTSLGIANVNFAESFSVCWVPLSVYLVPMSVCWVLCQFQKAPKLLKPVGLDLVSLIWISIIQSGF